MNERSKRFIRKIFWNYYSNAFREEEFLAGLPLRFEAREWGFIPVYPLPKIVMRRHISFQSPSEMKKFVLKNIPAHIYHSSAYYKHPGADKMEKKEWEGADLIFDIDGKIEEGYSQMLFNVKEEIIKLKDFLIDDFGFAEKEILTVFSGGRGYHIHVRDKCVLSMGNAERREILDYLTANGLIIESVLMTREVKGDYGARSGYSYRRVDSGWGKRIWNYIVNFLEEMGDIDEKDAIKKIEELGVGKRERIVKNISKKDAIETLIFIKDEKILEMMARKGKITRERLRHLVERVVEGSIKELSIKGLSPDTDEPVTSDIKRLIRLPGSIHGGSGLIARMVDNLDDFDPLVDAVVFSKEEKKIISYRNMGVEMMDNTYKIKKGENKVPEFVAVFLICRGVAEYGC